VLVRDVTEGWRRLASGTDPDARRTLDELRPDGMSDDAWSRYVTEVVEPLAELIRRLEPAIAGLSGPPGSGKSTLARHLAAMVNARDRRPFAISMDDFYLSKAERAERGLRFRGGPGSHDLGALIDVLRRAREERTPITIPRYSALEDDRAEPETLDFVPRPLILEGYFLGYGGDGYGEILEYVDLLVFIDVDMATSRERRFAREESLRAAGGGLTSDDMQRFWDEILEPGIARLVPDARRAADLVLVVDRDEGARTAEVDESRTDVIAALDGDSETHK
jgi:pantothenate kinase-related protein Tda10